MDLQRHSRDCELVIGIVAPVGVNLDDIQNRLKSLFEQFNYTFNFIHLSKISASYLSTGVMSSGEQERLDNGMEQGKNLRKKYKRGDFYALLAINAINTKRTADAPAPLKRYAHIIRSLKHPDEVETLRSVYGDGFFLLGISSDIENRKLYLKNDKGISDEHIDRLIKRDDKEPGDEKETGDYGQRTRDVFQLADAFITTDGTDSLSSQLSRTLDLLFSKPVVSPTVDEYAMFLAYAASLRSADLSRQVGAVIANAYGDVIATGANDVPKFGGGLYWPPKSDECESDQRDYMLGNDSNETEKKEIILKIMRKLKPGPEETDEELISAGKELLKDTGLLNITEYGRAVHAEMEAILSAARNGISIRGATLYSTTYPCHNCAKHIVAAGIVQVKYVEPYPKSYATKLHGDSIEADGKKHYQKVHFESFVGIGPRKFVDVFSTALSRGRNLERKRDGNLIEWHRNDAELRVPMKPLSYIDAETLLVTELADISTPLTEV